MNTGRTVFSQIIDYLPLTEFRKCVQRYRGNYKVKSFSCLDQFLCMAFAQMTYRESLRDIEACLRSMQNKLYHMGIRGKVSRNTLAHANETRDWRIYADFAQILIHQARRLYADDDFGVELDQTVYALDSTTIDLCLSLFPWAKFRKHKGAIKLHTLLELRGSIPTFIAITDGKIHDVNILDELIPEPGCFYIMDRGYLDFDRLYLLNLFHAFFIIRAKSNLQFRRLYSHPIDKSTGLRCDQTIALTGINSAEYYPEQLRRVRFFDKDTDKNLIFLSNNFILPADVIAQLYKCRWQIELFFKWIKQHLRIKSFYGTSENAVKTQVWIAISVYLLIAIIKKRLNLEMSLYTFMQILSVIAFEKTPLLQALTDFCDTQSSDDSCNQLKLFEL
ncbi:MAG: IS4 family transposase [Candidatus Aminicenantes bacterium]|nr:IS4 family transposase [Candidatus Aminicenantes bacterium]